MRKVNLVVAAFAITSVLPIISNAENISYNYIQAAYTTTDIDILGTSIDGNGFSISGSATINDNLAFIASFDDQSYDYDIDTNSFQFGLNFHTPVNKTTDILFGISILDSEVSQPLLGSEDDTGNVLGVGIRSKLNPNIEIDFGVSRSDIFDDSSTGFSLSLLARLNENIQLGIGYGSGDDTDTIGFSLRSNF